MAANKFATLLHRKTHRVTYILVYAILEWILIALLLLNGLFAYLIAKFAAYFGLKPPCLLCSRVDHLFEPDDAGIRSFRNLLCGAHAAEISGLGYCFHHRRLAEAGDMCEGCSSSWKKRKEAGEKDLACSCCRAVTKPSLHELENTGEQDLAAQIAEGHEKPGIFETEGGKTQEEEAQGYVLLAQEEQEEQEEKMPLIELSHVCIIEDTSLDVMAQGQEIVVDDERLVSVAALDEMTIADVADSSKTGSEQENEMNHGCGEHDTSALDIGVVLEEKRVLDSSVAAVDVVEENSVMPIPSAETILSCSSDPNEDVLPLVDAVVLEDTVDVEIEDSTAEEDIIVPQVSVTEAVLDDDSKVAEVETTCEVSIGSEICEREPDDHVVPFDEPVAALADVGDQQLESPHETTPNEQEASEAEQRVATSQRLDHLPTELNEVEEDRAAETPTYSEATTHSLDKKLLFERKGSASVSLDGSVTSEIEGGEPSTIDQLKSALQAERKALGALYAELEEERNAAAIATSQTMAMINRLQEEKAAMQMEALQYQRMMEEQSEYDQEALQLLNELVTKREREKQDLERELEVYRQKVLHYEDKERRRMASYKVNGVNGTSVSSSAEDSDEHSDEYCELGESLNGLNGSVRNSSDAVLSSGTDQENAKHLIALDDSLTYFEVERLSILEELKALEERLFTLEDEDSGDAKAVEHSSDDYDLSADGLHSRENGFADDLHSNGKVKYEGRNSSCRGKRLLPLFDAVGMENCDELPASVEEAEADNSTKSVSILAKEQERLAIVEEVDHVYERLQALEADKEFLRHCIKSLKKGDKGMDLLQEILQHLRELRNVELQVKNAGDALASSLASTSTW